MINDKYNLKLLKFQQKLILLLHHIKISSILLFMCNITLIINEYILLYRQTLQINRKEAQ